MRHINNTVKLIAYRHINNSITQDIIFEFLQYANFQTV